MNPEEEPPRGGPAAGVLRSAGLEAHRRDRRRAGDQPPRRIRDPVRPRLPPSRHLTDDRTVETGSPAQSQLQPRRRSSRWPAIAAQDDFHDHPPTTGHRRRASRAASRTDGCRAATPVKITVDPRGGECRPDPPVYDATRERKSLGIHFAGPTTSRSAGPIAEAAPTGRNMWQRHHGDRPDLRPALRGRAAREARGSSGVETTRQAISSARWALILLALRSLSLALINLFPFLPLDGGHIFWSVVEKVRGRPSLRTMERASAIGFVLIPSCS